MNGRDTYPEVGRRIRRYREAARQTQAQLATHIGVSRASIANIEAGRQSLLLHYVYAIAEALDLGSPVLLLPGAHEDTAPPDGMTEVPVPHEGLTEKQREDVIRLMGGGLHNSGGSTAGEER